MQTETKRRDTVPVWDPLIRIFHWSLAVFFFIAYITEDELLTVHVYAGYAVAGLIGFRVVWGLIGTRHARFSDFVTSPAEVLRYLGRLLTGSAPHHTGHNPAGGAMILALLVSLALTAFFGMTLIAGDGNGPLAGTFVAGWSGDWIEEAHEVFANLTLFLVLLHVAGVVVSSLLEGQNLVKAMITGRKTVSSPAAAMEDAPAGRGREGRTT
jgi:cytochrome b